MYRFILEDLKIWHKSKNRKPLVLRGARQVGKTWLIREFAKVNSLKVVEINFEEKPSLKSIFEDTNEPLEIINALNYELKIKIDIENTVLFLDEVQTFPVLLSKLRWFKEKLPQLAVVATGSLLDFTLNDYKFSMPVGRIDFLHLEPISYEEFLYNTNKQVLEYLQNCKLSDFSSHIHKINTELLKEYTLIGGMPEVVSNWLDDSSYMEAQKNQLNIIETYHIDFAKYKGKYNSKHFKEVLSYTTRNLGNKIVYTHINDYSQSSPLKEIVHLISMARVIHLVSSTSANGIPLDSEIKNKYNKAIFLDVGLANANLGVRPQDINSAKSISLVNKGAIAEQLAGQLLRTIDYRYIEPKLYYWQNSNKNSNAEIDYIIQHNSHVIPVEVKAGTKGSMQSLHNFMQQKGYKVAIRLDSNPPSIMQVNTTTSSKEKVSYTLLSLPLYMTGQIPRLLDKIFNEIK